MFYVYILESMKNGRFYIGYSDDPHRRLTEHNAGKVKSTRSYRPWKKVYTECYPTEAEAMRRERYLKSMKSHTFIRNLINKFVDTSRL